MAGDALQLGDDPRVGPETVRDAATALGFDGRVEERGREPVAADERREALLERPGGDAAREPRVGERAGRWLRTVPGPPAGTAAIQRPRIVSRSWPTA